jgi:hypothetical protein
MTDEPETEIDTPAEEDFVPVTEALIAAKIINTLMIYPFLSNSMLQVGIGTAISPKMWRPVLDKFLKDGIIVETKRTVRSPLHRDLEHKILQLAIKQHKYPE